MPLAPKQALAPGDALLIVDVQPDFCPGGALPISGGDAVIPVLNEWLAAARALGVPVYASRDWHPRGHMSFTERGGPWPPHCIQDTQGAEFHPALKLPPDAIVVTKGVRFDQDQNSAFDQTGLAVELKRAGVRRLWVGGLAEDVCVLASVLDARKAGFATHLIPEGARPVTAEGSVKARSAMRAAGALLE
ncbi:MAG: isochorismatase family protein [Alphaproteobacteria bacterium]|nr:isochorismatase family protein [Alphaproteobacteria bacterium]